MRLPSFTLMLVGSADQSLTTLSKGRAELLGLLQAHLHTVSSVTSVSGGTRARPSALPCGGHWLCWAVPAALQGHLALGVCLTSLARDRHSSLGTSHWACSRLCSIPAARELLC